MRCKQKKNSLSLLLKTIYSCYYNNYLLMDVIIHNEIINNCKVFCNCWDTFIEHLKTDLSISEKWFPLFFLALKMTVLWGIDGSFF